jgi:EAL domain-containing protein (putative c-di-GMP-specific phosphodiesterase class I)
VGSPSAAVNALRPAIERREIAASFQPVVDLATNRVIGFETVARWTRADGTVLPAEDLVSNAEEFGLAGELAFSMLDQAAALLEQIGLTATVSIGVGVSPTQLEDPDLPARFQAVLSRHRIPRIGMCLAIAETALMAGDASMKARLLALKRLGVRLAMDGFGAGCPSLAFITDFPFDVIKLDRRVVAGIEGDPSSATLVRGVVALARPLGLTVLAEGVETEAQRAALAGLGCHAGLGSLWSAGVPGDRARELAIPDGGIEPATTVEESR